MDLTILLSKIFGLYMLIAGIAIFMNRKHVMLAVVAIFKERFAQLLAGILSLLLGLLLINIHNDWSTAPAILISLLGWMVVVKGLVYLFMPESKLTKLMHFLSEREWYTVDAILAVVLGAYLAGYGYGLF